MTEPFGGAFRPPVPRHAGKAVVSDDGMSKAERAYAAHLGARLAAGEILRFDREPVNLRLAGSTYYRPDFRVVLPDLTIEMHEVKGRKGDGFYAKEDAWIKLKLAAELHPYRFLVVWPLKGGGFGSRVV